MLYEVNHGLSDKISSVMSHFCRNHCSFSPISINSYIVLKLLRRQKKTLPNQLYQFMIEMLTKETDTGMFPPKELSDYIMYGLNGDREGQKQLCKKALTAAIKKLPK